MKTQRPDLAFKALKREGIELKEARTYQGMYRGHGIEIHAKGNKSLSTTVCSSLTQEDVYSRPRVMVLYFEERGEASANIVFGPRTNTIHHRNTSN